MRIVNGSPALSEEKFLKSREGAGDYAESMTVKGTIQKTFILFILMLIPAAIIFNMGTGANPSAVQPYMWGGLIGGLIFSLVGIFSPKNAPWAAPVYALFEGLFLGAISALYNNIFYEGIVSQAVLLTFGVLLTMIGLYTGGILKATKTFKKVVIVGTGAIAMVYFLTIILQFFGTTIPYIHGNGLMGIGFSLVVIVLAALNFIMDFDMIEEGEKQSAPKYMEWYGGMAIMITLVWLYIEILRLLSKLSSRD